MQKRGLGERDTSEYVFDIDAERGLSNKQVQKLRFAGFHNKSVTPPSKSFKKIVFSNVFTYFNFVFVIIALILCSVHSYRDLTFLPVIIANTLIGIIQEIRAKITLDQLSILNAPTATVIREGEQKKIDAEWLVLNDVVIFRAGNQIPADAQIISGEVSVNESLLTGEADEIKKVAGDELLSGSFIVSGECRAKLTKVGADSYISQLTLQAKKIKTKEQSEIIRSLNRIVTIAGIAIIPIGAFIFIQSFFFNQASMQDSVQAAVAAVIGMIPEGLFLLSSIALAISAIKLAQKKVLLHDMKSIETLARVDVLCVDKTGTITDNTMLVQDFLPLGKTKPDDLRQLISDFAAAQSADNITMEALKKFFDAKPSQKAKSVSGFSSEFKYSGVNFAKESYVLGAPEFLLGKDYKKYAGEIEKHSRKGYRVLLFAQYDGKANGKKLTGKITPVGLILMMNPVRENAAETFKYFADQGVTIKVISGDNALTVSEVAKKAKIANASKYIDASRLTTDEEIAEALRKYTVFGRVTPEQKRKFVKALQADGHTVAMTGDGVNDVLALRDADCSVAMASGSDAATQAAQLVLLESDFSRMPDVVTEGRRVVNNLERSGSLFLVKNVFSFLTATFAILFAASYPLLPRQVSLIAIFTIGVPGFLLSQAPNHDLIRGKFVSNILRRSVPGGLADVILIGAVVLLCHIFSVSPNEVGTCATILLACVGIQMVYRVTKKPLDWYKAGVILVCIFGLIGTALLLPWLFGIEQISIQATTIVVVLGLLSIPLLHYVGKFIDWCWTIPRKLGWWSRR
ncbi:HAD-IC family P-type ATPase [Candidatus Saccharibacteria bacterium]|nr:HAD-IC family P-type ATPase [Candidatus Saccharibacteria bacterium]